MILFIIELGIRWGSLKRLERDAILTQACLSFACVSHLSSASVAGDPLSSRMDGTCAI